MVPCNLYPTTLNQAQVKRSGREARFDKAVEFLTEPTPAPLDTPANLHLELLYITVIMMIEFYMPKSKRTASGHTKKEGRFFS